jgi:transposase
MDAQFVGIDVSKDRLDVHVLPKGEAFAVARNGEGLAALNERLAGLGVVTVAVEATGGFETVVAASLAGAGLPVVVVNPAQVRAFAQALGKRAKSDPIDAAVLARFVEATRPEIRPLPDEQTQALADLVARRRQIVQMIAAEHQREKRAMIKRVKRSIQRLVLALEKELAELDKSIDDMVRGSPAWRRNEDLLRTVRASVRSSPAPCSPRCPSSEPSTGAKSLLLPASPPGLASPANGRAKASSAAGAAPCVPSSLPGQWPLLASTPP